MPARRHSEAGQAEALDVAAREGFAAAEEASGIPSGTLRNLAHRASVGVDLPPEVRALPWSRRRPYIVGELGQAAAEALTATRAAIAEGDLRSARDGAVTLGVLIDKAQLLDGGATGRFESANLHAVVEVPAPPSNLRAEIERLRAELGHTDALPPAGDEEEAGDDA